MYSNNRGLPSLIPLCPPHLSFNNRRLRHHQPHGVGQQSKVATHPDAAVQLCRRPTRRNSLRWQWRRHILVTGELSPEKQGFSDDAASGM